MYIALKCFSILNSRGNFRFWVIGKPETTEYGKKIYKIARDLRLNNNLKFWGFVPKFKKFELLSKSHVLINPSLREGWGLVNIEANSMGTPVVAYNSRGLVDSVKDKYSGSICQKNSPEQLSKNVIDLLSEEKKYQEMIKSSIEWSKNFSWTKSGKESLRLLERLTK